MPAPDRHLFQVHPEAGVALLVAGLPVVPVVDANDGEVRRVDDGRGRERTDVHEELAVSGHHQHPAVGAGEGEAETHGGGRAHRARERENVRRVVAEPGEVAGGSREARHDEEVLVASDEPRHRLVTVEGEFGGVVHGIGDSVRTALRR